MPKFVCSKVLILSQEPLRFIVNYMHYVLFPPSYPKQARCLLLHLQKEVGVASVSYLQ